MSSTIQRPLLLTALLSAALAVSTARAEPPGPGASDFTRTDPSAIQASDIIQAMSPARQTAIKAAEPPAGNAAAAPKGKRSHKAAPARDERPRVLLPIYFEFGSAEPTEQSRKVLEAVSEALRSPELANGQFLIEGHTDAIGSAPENQSLSVERAQTVEAYLEQRGVAADRLRFVGRGEAAPIATNDSEDGRQRNRRVELIRLSAND
jgi:OOP family OmpA-OmpF porin